MRSKQRRGDGGSAPVALGLKAILLALIVDDSAVIVCEGRREGVLLNNQREEFQKERSSRRGMKRRPTACLSLQRLETPGGPG